MKFIVKSENTDNFYVDLLDEYGDLFEKHGISVVKGKLNYGMGYFKCVDDVYYIDIKSIKQLVGLMDKLDVDVEIRRNNYPGLDEPIKVVILYGRR